MEPGQTSEYKSTRLLSEETKGLSLSNVLPRHLIRIIVLRGNIDKEIGTLGCLVAQVTHGQVRNYFGHLKQF